MENNIIEISNFKPHLSGELKCMSCNNTWVGVVPLGENGEQVSCECPKCGLMKGVFNYPIEPSEGETIYKCPCGGEFFTLMPTGCRCTQCGQTTILDEVYEAYS